MIDFSSLLQGFMLGLGMFICPGPKDLLILRASLVGRSPVVLVCIGTGCDVVLIALGILGLSAAFQAVPVMQTAATISGIFLLVLHGWSAARSALTMADPRSGSATVLAPGSGAMRQLFVVSLLNPAAWLDTVLVIGAIGVALAPEKRWSYSAGAVAASLVWFTALVLAARQARVWMASARNWRILDATIAVAMLGMAAWLAWGIYPPAP